MFYIRKYISCMMAKPLPKWIMKDYSRLWARFKGAQFDHAQASKALKGNASVMLMHMKKNGWLEASLDKQDSRKRKYTLKSPEQAVEEMAK